MEKLLELKMSGVQELGMGKLHNIEMF